MLLLLKQFNKNLKSTTDVLVDLSVAGAYNDATFVLAAVAAGVTPTATSNAKCRIRFKTAELSCNRNENLKGRLIFKFFNIITRGVGSISKGTYTIAIVTARVAAAVDTVVDVAIDILLL